ncbi:DUF805 domain-containing protein [Psittacicella hinzii]|uniref:DUF805 domain-containing protein n=1 Tax=Psittacicella hinzii TaxID=2028575 RepID=A0A3A1YFG8_9GAMM|nr:DUF805 domain-containing protein [Psittacicella hinzii]RIY34974.1 hypothetical protein CKF58_07300 [Psittacicella hinzii]
MTTVPFTEVLKVCWANKNNVQGCIRRREYFLFTLWMIILSFLIIIALCIVALIAALITGTPDAPSAILAFANLILAGFNIFLSIPHTIRRCHDLGLHGAFWLLFFIPLVNVIFGLYLLFAPTKFENNPYLKDKLFPTSYYVR